MTSHYTLFSKKARNLYKNKKKTQNILSLKKNIIYLSATLTSVCSKAQNKKQAKQPHLHLLCL